MSGRAWILAGLAAVAAVGPLRAGGAPHPRIRSGNRAYDAADYVGAEVEYRKALEGRADLPEGRFDLGDALYRQGRYETAAGEFEHAEVSADAALRADAAFNRGNALFRQQKYPESIRAYTDALRADPTHEDARYNLSVARRRLRAQRQAGQPKTGEQGKRKDQQPASSKPDSSASSPASPPKEPPDASRSPQPPEASNPDSSKSSADARDAGSSGEGEAWAGEPAEGEESPERAISPAEAARILQAVRDDEKEVQKKLRARTAGRVNVEKDW